MVVKYGMEKGLKIIADAGFDGVDYGFDILLSAKMVKDNDRSSILYDEQKSIEYAKELKKVLDKLGLEACQTHAPFPTRRRDITEEQNELLLTAIKNCFKISQIIGAKKMVVHPYFWGNIRSHFPEEETHEGNMKLYVPLIDTIRETGVICCLENMWTGDPNSKKIYSAICSDPNEANAMIDELNEIAGEELFGFCLDIGHLLIIGSDPYWVIPKLGKRIKCFHVHDNDGADDLHVCPYFGIYHWDKFAEAVRKLGYTDPLDFETGGTFDHYFKDDRTIVAAHEMLHAAGRHIIKMIEEPEDDEN